MKIITCVKRVPATTTRVVIDASTKSLDPTGVEFLLNPYDEFAVEQALQVAAAHEGSTVTAISLGNAAAQKELRTVLAMGADDAVLLTNDLALDADVTTTARILAEAIRGREFDLLFFGTQAVDNDAHGVGPAVATMLGVPCLTEVVKFELDGDKVICEREVEGGREILESPLPCAITCQKGLNEPRYANLKGIMKAKKKPLEITEVDLGAPALEVIDLLPPADRPAGRIIGEGAAAVAELVDALRNEAKVL